MNRIVDWFTFDLLTHPWMLALIPVAFVLMVLEMRARPYGALRVSTGETLARIQRAGSWLRRAPAVLRAAGLAMLIVALARPLDGLTARVQNANVIDILLCVDVSGSMTQEDFVVNNQRRDRLYVTKLAVQDFIGTRKPDKAGRYGTDRLGLVLYASVAWMQVPLTLDYGLLAHEVSMLDIDKNDEKRSKTAIGSALGLAVSNLDKSEAKSKVIILLTDGQNNWGNLDPITAAQLAKEFGIRVYTIGAGSSSEGYIAQRTLFGTVTNTAAQPIDEETLKRIADTTGAKYFRATDAESLQQAYLEINELERTKIEAGSIYDYKDAFVPYALVGGLAVSLSIFSQRRWFDPVP